MHISYLPSCRARCIAIGAILAANAALATDITWTGTSGDWDNPANWSTGTLPGPDDDVVIDRPGDITVTHSAGTHTVKSLLCQEAFVLSGGSLTVSGTIQVNNGFSLSGGSLVRATVLQGTNGQAITLTSFTSAALDGVTLAGDLKVGLSASLSITNGLTFAGGPTITLHVSDSVPPSAPSLKVASGAQTIGGAGQIVLAGPGIWNSVQLGNGGETTLTLGPGVTVRGRGDITQASASTLLNQGTIAADVSGEFLGIWLSQFTNSGAVSALNGATLSISADWGNRGTLTAHDSTLMLSRNWSNTGTITASNSTLNLDGSFTQAGLGTFNRTGGTVNLMGTLNGGLTLDAATGSWDLNGGTIRGGTVSMSGGAELMVGHGTLDGVSLASDLSIASLRELGITNGLTLVGGATITLNSSGLTFPRGTQTIGGNGQIVLASGAWTSYLLLGYYDGLIGARDTVVTVGPGVTIRGQGGFGEYYPSTLVNQGVIQADTPGQSLTIVPEMINRGALRAINGGTLGIARGHSLSGGTLHVGINSRTEYGRILFRDPLVLVPSGEFTVAAANGFRPNPGDTFTVLLAYASATNDFPCYSGLDLGGGLMLVPQFGKTALTLTTTVYATNSAQPELFVVRSRDAVRVLWPLGFTNWVLESATNLPSTNWLTISAPCGSQALVPTTLPERFFRLKSP